jgi:hypothetical protein
LFVGVKALEKSENLLLILGLDADAVVLYGEEPGSRSPAGCDFDLGSICSPILHVADQILKELKQVDLWTLKTDN